MAHTVIDRRGKIILRTEDLGYAKHYAKHIGGRVGGEKSRLIRNTSDVFGSEEGTVSDRKNLFGQYQTTPSFVWCRETIQNSVDNKATKVRLTTIDIKDGPYAGCTMARIVDNGTGMDLDTLRTKFLCMSGTGKGPREQETDTIGGFGEAKKVILLAWQAWRVITKRADMPKAVRAEAVNGWKNYDREYIDPPEDIARQGTIVEVICWPNDYFHSISVNDAHRFVSYCDLPNVNFDLTKATGSPPAISSGDFAYNIETERFFYDLERTAASQSGYRVPVMNQQIFINHSLRNLVGNFELGRAQEIFTAPIRKSKDTDETVDRECAKLYYKRFTKDEIKYASPTIFFRAKGLFLWMDQSIIPAEARGNVIIDFTVKTTLILSDNRDGIKNKVLDSLIKGWMLALAEDPRNVLRGYSKDRTFVYKGAGESFRAPTKPAALAAAQKFVQLQYEGQTTQITKQKMEKAIDKIADETAQKIIDIEAETPTESPIKSAPEVIREMIRYQGKRTKEADIIQQNIEKILFIPEYVLYIEEDLQAAGFKIPEKFKPEKLTKELKKIIAVWAEMIRLVFMMKNSNQTYAVGYTFSEEIKGVYMPSGFFKGQLKADGAILVNAYMLDMENRNVLIDVDNPEHLEKMWSICVHECTHMIDGCSKHNESFAYYLTDNISIVARVYPLVEIIANIVKTEEPLARAKFAKGLEVEDYLSKDMKRGRRPKSYREKQLEKFAVEMATVLASSGTLPPKPEEFELDIPDDLWEAVTLAMQAASSSKTAGGLQTDLLIKSLRNRLAAAEEKSKLLEKAKPIEEPTIVSRSARKPLFRKYN